MPLLLENVFCDFSFNNILSISLSLPETVCLLCCVVLCILGYVFIHVTSMRQCVYFRVRCDILWVCVLHGNSGFGFLYCLSLQSYLYLSCPFVILSSTYFNDSILYLLFFSPFVIMSSSYFNDSLHWYFLSICDSVFHIFQYSLSLDLSRSSVVVVIARNQCDQIGRFIGLWASF